MRKVLFPSAAILLAAPALAADLPSRAEPPAPSAPLPPAAAAVFTGQPLFSWTGFYAGVHGGYAWGDADGTLTTTTTAPAVSTSSRSLETSGFLGGLHAGYNFQSGMFVYGLEADAEYSMVDGDLTTTPGRYSVKQDFRGSLRARFGLAYDGVLLYVTGGGAAARSEASYVAAGRAEKSSILYGWTAGAGIEYDIWRNWSMRAEYRYTSLGDQDLSFPGSVAAANDTNSYKWNVEHTDHAVRVGLTYRLGGSQAGSRPIFARF